jgi:hypothetical protein
MLRSYETFSVLAPVFDWNVALNHGLYTTDSVGAQ